MKGTLAALVVGLMVASPALNASSDLKVPYRGRPCMFVSQPSLAPRGVLVPGGLDQRPSGSQKSRASLCCPSFHAWSELRRETPVLLSPSCLFWSGVTVFGGRCSPRGAMAGEAAAQHDEGQRDGDKKEDKYECELCNCRFSKLKNFKMHLEGKQHKTNEEALDQTYERYLRRPGSVESDEEARGGVTKWHVVRAWRSDEIDALPMRATCLCPSTMLGDLAPAQQARIWKYVSEVMPYSEFLPSVVWGLAHERPEYLRVKELFESCEAFRCVLGTSKS